MLINPNKWINLGTSKEPRVPEVRRPNESQDREGKSFSTKSFSQMLKDKLSRRIQLK